jgi:hypothetical protein
MKMLIILNKLNSFIFIENFMMNKFFIELIKKLHL